MNYFIVNDKAFNNSKDAKIYCKSYGIDLKCIIEMMPVKKRYFELYTQSYCNRSLFSCRYLTDEEVNRESFQEYLKDLKNGELCSIFIHFKEISEAEYFKNMQN